MKAFAIAAGAALVVGFAAQPAAAAAWSAAYGGTIIATYADGHAVKVFVNADHSYTIVPATGGTISGTWADQGDQSCFTITAPAAYAGGAPVCVALKEYKVGDSFTGKDSTGAFTGVIQAGR